VQPAGCRHEPHVGEGGGEPGRRPVRSEQVGAVGPGEDHASQGTAPDLCGQPLARVAQDVGVVGERQDAAASAFDEEGQRPGDEDDRRPGLASWSVPASVTGLMRDDRCRPGEGGAVRVGRIGRRQESHDYVHPGTRRIEVAGVGT